MRLLVTQLCKLRSWWLQSSFSVYLRIGPMVWIAKHFAYASGVGAYLTDYPTRKFFLQGFFLIRHMDLIAKVIYDKFGDCHRVSSRSQFLVIERVQSIICLLNLLNL